MLFTTTAASLILANFINVRSVSRVGSRRMMYGGLGCSFGFSVLLFLVTLAGWGIVWTAICFFMIIGSLGIISVNAESLVLIGFPNQASSASAVTRTLRFSTGALVGPILALIYTGTPVPVTALVLIAVFMACLIQVITHRRYSDSQKKAGEIPG